MQRPTAILRTNLLRCSNNELRQISYHALPRHQKIQRRTFFGIGEIVGVLANPGETLRSLADARKSLEEARQEMRENKERAQVRPVHTFSPLPGFFSRPAEIRAIQGALEGAPSFTVIFGASSVGKTALLREVLTQDRYHVLFFDLRIAGFADLGSLYFSLVTQMEQFFERLTQLPGWKDWEKEAWAFKHDRTDVERRLAEGQGTVEVSDVARVMELFQSCLLRYWQFEPTLEDIAEDEAAASDGAASDEPHLRKQKNYERKTPVVFFDEAHKLPALIQSPDTMKMLLDSMLVLTKQDHLCHVIHATSDSFYQTWLRQMNVMQHCKIISIGDCSKSETKRYFYDRLMQDVPDSMQKELSENFEKLYEAFGGKLTHWADYVSDYVNAKGKLTVEQTSHFLQAHALLNLHLIHSNVDTEKASKKDFEIYSPLNPSPHASPAPFGPNPPPAADGGDDPTPSFTSRDLLTVMKRLTSPDTPYLPYFPLCRELGADCVDAMVRGRILELRWTSTVTPESGDVPLEPTVGPKLVPTTPILSYAMRTVLAEWEKDVAW